MDWGFEKATESLDTASLENHCSLSSLNFAGKHPEDEYTHNL